MSNKQSRVAGTRRFSAFFTTLFALCMVLNVNADEDKHEHSEHDQHEQTLKNLTKVMPGAADLMIVMGERYKNLYWAAQTGKWDFAEYQAEEMLDLLEKLMITRPKRGATAREFVKDVYPMLPKAIKSKNKKVFNDAFEKTRKACMHCHVVNDHDFIKLPAMPNTATSPVLNMK